MPTQAASSATSAAGSWSQPVAGELFPIGARALERRRTESSSGSSSSPTIKASRARQVQMQTTHEVKMRFASDIAAGWRLVYGSLTLNITGIVNVEMRNVELLLTCEEVKQP